MSYSELFDLTLGVKQGEPLSPLLFILFINDIKDYMDFTNLSVNDIEKLSLYMLLFADDIALFTTDPNNLQTQLDCINRFSCQWGLKINVDKTKICIFERKKSRNNYTWCINNIDVEIVDSFCYLGMKFYYNGNFNQAIKTLNEQALKAYNGLLSLFTRVSLDIKTKLLLFDSKVAPIIRYGSEIWGVYDFKEVDKLHVKFCKYILGVRPQTSTVAVLGELGRFPLSVICKERALKYWCKIMKNSESLPSKIFQEQIHDVSFNSLNLKNSWGKAVNNLLDNLGYGYLWSMFDYNCSYVHMLKQRIRDQYIQTWCEIVSSQSKLYYFNKFKTVFKYEKYLDAVDHDNYRIALTKLRLCSHQLEIETGRFNNVDRVRRLCKLCNLNVVESEFHFVLCCPLYQELRRKYNIPNAFNTMNKFIKLMSSTQTGVLRRLAKFVYFSMKQRSQTLDCIAS